MDILLNKVLNKQKKNGIVELWQTILRDNKSDIELYSIVQTLYLCFFIGIDLNLNRMKKL